MVISDSVRANSMVQKGYEDCMLSFTPSSLKVRESSSVIAKYSIRPYLLRYHLSSIIKLIVRGEKELLKEKHA